MSALFDGPNEAPKVNTYELAKDLADATAVNEAPTIELPVDPSFNHVLGWASEKLTDAGVKPEEMSPSLGEVMRAAFEQENSVASYLSSATASEESAPLSAEDLFNRVDRDGLLPVLSHFEGVASESEYEAVKANIARETENRRLLEASGMLGMAASFAAAVADPINFVPVGGAAARVAKLATRGGRSPVLETAVAALGGSAVAEGALQSTQELRSAQESGVNIAAATLLGGALGFAVDRAFGREIADKVEGRFDAARNGEVRGTGGAAVADAYDAAAARALDNGEKLGSLGIGDLLVKVGDVPGIGKYLASPARDLMRSTSPSAREAIARLASDPLVTSKQVEGVRAFDNVEAAFGAVRGEFGQAKYEIGKLYRTSKGSYASREDFNTKVARALANGDKSGDPVATEAAKVMRKRVFDPIRQQLVKNGVMSNDEAELLNADSYFPVVYDVEAIIGDKQNFIDYHHSAFERTLFEDVRQALIAKETRASDIEDTVIEFKGVRQRVPKVDENGDPVINPKTGKQVMMEKIITKGKFRELRDEAMATFKAEETELRAERDTVLAAFNKGDDWPYAGPADLDNPFVKQFEARDKLRERQAKIEETQDEQIKTINEVRDAEIEAINREAANVTKRVSTTNQGAKVGEAKQKDLNRAKSDAQKTIAELKKKNAPKLAEIDKELDEQAALIDANYAERIDTAKTSRDEVIDAANDQAVKQILSARGVELEEGMSTVLRRFARNNSVDEYLVSVEAQKRANSLFDAVTKRRQFALEHEVAPGLRGYMKARKNPAHHVDLMDKRWAVSDAMQLAERYTQTAGMDGVLGQFFRRLVPKLDLQGGKVFDGNGKLETVEVADVGLTQIRKRIADDHLALTEGNVVPEALRTKLFRKFKDDPAGLDNALRAATVKQTSRLNELAKRDLEALDSVLAFARGTAADPGQHRLQRAAEVVGMFNFVRLMGGQVISSLGDPINLVISQGWGNTLRHAVLPMLRDFREAYRNADGDLRSLSRLAGANLELEFNATMAEIGGLTSPWVKKDSLTWMRLASEKFSGLSGIKYWNAFWKQVSYNTIQARIIENAQKGWGSLSKAERAWMANLGLDEARLSGILGEFEKQGVKSAAGIPLAKWDEWADQGLAEAFRAAAYKESFNIVITPGLADKLNAHASPVGRTMMQFRNHMFANQARLVARNAQLAQLDRGKLAGAFTGVFGLVMMGVLIDALKQMQATTISDPGNAADGEDIWKRIETQWSDNPAQAAYNAIDRTGLGGLVFEGSNIMNKAGLGGLQGLLRMVSGEDETTTARTANQNFLDLVGGATAGLAQDVVTTVGRFSDAVFDEEKDLTLGDFRRAQRLMPGSSLPYVRVFLNEGNRLIGTQYDWPAPAH